MPKENGKRKYEKRKRAESEAETRLRITEAAVELHGTVGPARTSFSAIAERAGVQRATLYRHFPDLPAMFAACSAHYLALNPPPDPTPWAMIDDPNARLRTALGDLYAFYERGEPMLSNVIRDAPVVPGMAAAVNARLAYLEAVRDLLLKGRSGARRRRVRAAIAHVLAFETWHSLAREQGLPRRDAVALAHRDGRLCDLGCSRPSPAGGPR